MKKIVFLCFSLAFGALIFATGCSSSVKEGADKASYPISFQCIHGGGTLTIANAKDAESICDVCDCGQKKKNCQP